jgi:hypothetical protein
VEKYGSKLCSSVADSRTRQDFRKGGQHRTEEYGTNEEDSEQLVAAGHLEESWLHLNTYFSTSSTFSTFPFSQ